MVRGKGEGSIYQRSSDNRWVAQIEGGRSAGRRRRYARAVRRTRKEAQAALKELQRAADAGLIPGQSSTVETFLTWWLDHALGDVSEATKARYRRTVDDWITPHLGKIRLNKLSPGDVQRMLRRLEEQGLSPKPRQLARDLLSRALRWAEQSNVVGRNVARIVQGPKSSRKISDALTAAQAEAVLARAKGDRLEALAVVALRLGLRQGEALGLRWQDVDLEHGELTVTKGKTTAAARTIPLVASTAAALKEHRRRQAAEQLAAGPLWQDTGHVFTTQQGKPIHPPDRSRLVASAHSGRRGRPTSLARRQTHRRRAPARPGCELGDCVSGARPRQPVDNRRRSRQGQPGLEAAGTRKARGADPIRVSGMSTRRRLL